MSYDTTVSPVFSYIIWYACVVLAIQAMSMPSEAQSSNKSKAQFDDALYFMTATLRRWAVLWPVANTILGKLLILCGKLWILVEFLAVAYVNQSSVAESIEELLSWKWLELDPTGRKDLINRLRTFLDPTREDPTRIEISLSNLVIR